MYLSCDSSMSSTSDGETIAERSGSRLLCHSRDEVELPRALGVLSRDVSPLGALDRSEVAGVRSEPLSLDREAVNRLGVNFSNAVTGESTVRVAD